MNGFLTNQRSMGRSATLVAVLFVVTAGVARTQEMDVTQAYLVNAFERAKAWDVSMAEAIPDSALGWAPNADVRGFAAQVVHGANNTFIGMAAFGKRPPAFGNEGMLVQDKAALATAITSAYDWIIEQLNGMQSSDLAAEAEFFGRTMPRWRICMFALEHAMWTRGQLVPYLHAHGVAVPQQMLF